MTAAPPTTARAVPVTDTRLRWRRLAAVTLRQHRASLAAYAAFALLVTVGMAVTGLILHGSHTDVFSVGPHSLWPLYDRTGTALRLILPLTPVLAGLFLGTPMVAREIETGTARFAWTQGAGQIRWLLASVVPIALILMVVGAGLGLEFRWWLRSSGSPDWFWSDRLFALNPLPLAGWSALGLSLGVLLGAAIRRTVPAMAATLVCGLPGMYAMLLWQRGYLPPLRQAAAHPVFSSGGGYGYSVPLTSRAAAGHAQHRAGVARRPAADRRAAAPHRGLVPRAPHPDLADLPAEQPVLPVPVHRARLARHGGGAPHRGHRPRPPPRSVLNGSCHDCHHWADR
jgi:hypothetical protein